MEIAAKEVDNGPKERLNNPDTFETVFDTIIKEMVKAGLIEAKTEPLSTHDRPGTTLRTYYSIPLAALVMQDTYIPKEMLADVFDEMQQAYGELHEEVIDLRSFIFSRGLKEEYRDYLKRLTGHDLPKRPHNYLALRYVKRER